MPARQSSGNFIAPARSDAKVFGFRHSICRSWVNTSVLMTSLREFLTKYKADAEVINKEGGYSSGS
ncbi:hypothetical protein [Acinetobacter sp. PW68]|uniref:hypothetical protein n=1 Tax=Acinetobacter sp. PW68 TaxID=2865162 RepID=UPI001E38EAD9|nr:hypothetical protein [Acinetobacter sp. PW68]